MLTKKDIIFERDAQGKVMPTTMWVPTLEAHIRFKPMTRADVIKLMQTGDEKTEQDQDLEVVKNHLVEPHLDQADLKCVKWKTIGAIAQAILSYSMGALPKDLENAQKKDTDKLTQVMNTKNQKKSEASPSSYTTEDTTTSTSTA